MTNASEWASWYEHYSQAADKEDRMNFNDMVYAFCEEATSYVWHMTDDPERAETARNARDIAPDLWQYLAVSLALLEKEGVEVSFSYQINN